MDELDFGYIFGISTERSEVRPESVFVMSTNGECLVFFSALQTNSLYFPPTITSPLPDYNRQCDPDDANDRNDDVRDDDLISNGGDTLGYRWTPVVLSLFMLGHVVM